MVSARINELRSDDEAKHNGGLILKRCLPHMFIPVEKKNENLICSTTALLIVIHLFCVGSFSLLVGRDFLH